MDLQKMHTTNTTTASFLQKCVAAVVAPALLASTILLGNGLFHGNFYPAYAKAKSCKDKRKECESRCRGRYPGDWREITSCYSRTCDKQNENCTKDASVPSKHAPPENPTKNWGEGVRPTGGNKPLPSKPKIMGDRPPLSGVKQSPGAGGGGPILRSGGGIGGGSSSPGGRPGGGRR
jgi:hypothetical protein